MFKKWSIITIIQIVILLLGALGVYKIGIELYWNHTGERFQINEIDGYISNFIRIIVLVAIIVYIIIAIIYFFKSKKRKIEKL